MPNKEPTSEETIATQQQIIKHLRETITELDTQLETQQRQMSRLREIEQDYNELRSVFGSNGNLTYYQAMNTVLTRKNAAAEAERQRSNLERQQAFEAKQAAEREAEEKEVTDSNPDLIKFYQGQKDKIQQTKTTMLDLAERFYDMTEDEARAYIAIEHRPEESAVKHLINEYLDDQGKFTIYQCNYCEEEFKYGLSDFEDHVYRNGQDHRDINLRRIESDAITETNKINTELAKHINDAIKTKKEAERKKEHQQQQAEQAKAKRNLPFVPKP